MQNLTCSDDRSSMTSMSSNKRVVIIGAGPAGLSVLRAFEAAKDSGASVPEIICFEKEADWGGHWNQNNWECDDDAVQFYPSLLFSSC